MSKINKIIFITFVLLSVGKKHYAFEEPYFVESDVVSIYNLIIQPEKYVNKVIVFKGFWRGSYTDINGSISPNRDMVEFPDQYSRIPLILRKSYRYIEEGACDYVHFTVQGKLIKTHQLYILVDAILARTPNFSNTKQTIKCSLGLQNWEKSNKK